MEINKRKPQSNVSVIVPIKNHRIVERLLDVITNLHFSYWIEIVVIDGSEKEQIDIRDKFPKVRWLPYVSKSKFSVAEQRNFGIRKARGDIIAFIDADCVPEKNWLENLVEPIRAGNESITGGLVKSVRKYPRKWEWEFRELIKTKYMSFAPTMCSAWRKSVFDHIGFYDERFIYGSEDLDICRRAIQNGYKIRSVPSAIVYHDWGSIMRNISRVWYYGKGHFLFFEKHHKDILQKKDTGLIYGILAFPTAILLSPIAIIWPYYLFVFFLPLINNFKKTKSFELMFEETISGLIHGFGFIISIFETLFNRNVDNFFRIFHSYK